MGWDSMTSAKLATTQTWTGSYMLGAMAESGSTLQPGMKLNQDEQDSQVLAHSQNKAFSIFYNNFVTLSQKVGTS